MAGRAHEGQEPCLVLREAQGDQGAPELTQDHGGAGEQRSPETSQARTLRERLCLERNVPNGQQEVCVKWA